MTGAASKDWVFRDPVHGLIELRGEHAKFAGLLQTRAMQRLRRIKQMGFAWLVYPGAEHSRFGHALGAMHIAGRVAKQLRLPADVTGHVMIAALLHDVGHGPFSHAWEHVFPATTHEQWGMRIMREDAELVAALQAIEPGLPDTMARFWGKTYRPHYVRKLVSSQLDVDRLDYLLRDGHYSGAGYATFDLEWILHAIRVAEVHPEASGDERLDLVVDYRRGMYAVEQYLFARSYMYSQVYHHKTVRAAEWMFIKLFRRFVELATSGHEPPGLPQASALARGEPIDIAAYMQLHDVSIVNAIDTWAGRTAAPAAADPVIADLAARLVDRRLFKTIDLGDDAETASAIAPRLRELAVAKLGPHGNYYLEVDDAIQVGYRGGVDELHVIGHPRHGTVTLGRLLEDMPLGQPLSAIRIVCAPELLADVQAMIRA
ncbi:MAG: HD domain-containing protein [Myxococcales bacterium]|nr:HD domain-containing protein [Myxococcales bacterium]